MNILFLLRLWPVYGGGETVTICLANELVKRGCQVSVAFFKESNKAQMPFIDKRVKAVRLDGGDSDEFHCDMEKTQSIKNDLLRIVKNENIDIIIDQWWPVEFICDIKRSCPDVKVVKCLHTTFYKLIMDDPQSLRRMIKKLLKPVYAVHKKKAAVSQVMEYLPYVDKYVFLSPAFQREFEAMGKYDNRSGKLDSIPNPTVYQNWAVNESLANKENVVLVVGRMLEGCKKITRILKVWHELEKIEKLGAWRLEIVGDGPDLIRYKQMASDLGLQRVSFEGYQQPLPYYQRAKIFLMTSAFEGFGMTLVESLQQGVVPVVMDSFSSLHDIVKDGYNGRIVAEGDISGFAKAVTELMENSEMRNAMAMNGLESSRLFSVEKVVDRWQRLLSSMTSDMGGAINNPPTSCCELKEKTISVVMPSYGRAHLLKKTIPTYLQKGVVELILVDDCSPDNTREVVEDLQKTYPQIKYLRNERNMKQTASKNRGIDLAKGDYIYFGDDDSVLLPGSIKYLKQTLEYYEAGAVMARPICAGPNYEEKHHDKYVSWITKRGLTSNICDIYDVAHLRFDWGKYMLCPIEVPCMPACLLVKKELAKSCRFDTNYHGCAYREETDFSFRLSLDFGAKLMYDARAVQLNLPNYMVKQTGARAGGYEVWRKSALECNQYFLDKNWDKISRCYHIHRDIATLQKEFEESLADRKISSMKVILKNLYFYFLYHV